MKIQMLSLSAALFSLNAFAADPSIYCVLETKVSPKASGSDYVVQFTIKGSIASNTAMMNVKRTEFGVVRSGSQWVVDRSNVMNANIIDVPYRGWVVSPKNTSANWKTYVVQNPVNDGYIAAASLTLSNQKVSDPMYGNTYRAILSLTTIGDESNYTQKVQGTCSIGR